MDDRRSSMKIHRVVQMLGATTSTGKLASDMYDIGKKHYHSEAHGQKIPVSEMDFQHMVRAFVNMCDQEEVLDRSKHMGRVRDQAKFYDDIIEKNDKIYKKNLQEQEDKILALSSKICNLLSTIEEKEESAEYWKNTYYNSQPKDVAMCSARYLTTQMVKSLLTI